MEQKSSKCLQFNTNNRNVIYVKCFGILNIIYSWKLNLLSNVTDSEEHQEERDEVVQNRINSKNISATEYQHHKQGARD